MTGKKLGSDLTNGSVLFQLALFVVPLILANFVQQIYNTVDMMVIGQFAGNAGTVGVSTGGEVATLLTFAATGFGSAGQIYVAQLTGAKDAGKLNETIGTLLSFMFIISTVFAVICIVFSGTFLGWLNCPEEAVYQAKNYMQIVSLGIPFVFGYNAVCGILRGMGEGKRPLIFISIAAGTNIILDLLFVALFSLEAAGTAIATVLAQIVAFMACAVSLYRHRESFHFRLKLCCMKPRREHLKVLMSLGIPLTAQSLLVQMSLLICSSRINLYGVVASGTNSIGNKIQKLVNVFTSSIITGSGAMIGQNLGARKYDRVKKIVSVSLFSSLFFAVLGSIIVNAFPDTIYRLFTKDASVIALGRTYLHIAVATFLLSAIQGPFQAVITGSGNARLSFVSGLLDGVVLRLGISFCFAYLLDMGVTGFFWGNALARFAPVFIGITYYLSGKWKTRKLLSEQ